MEVTLYCKTTLGILSQYVCLWVVWTYDTFIFLCFYLCSLCEVLFTTFYNFGRGFFVLLAWMPDYFHEAMNVDIEEVCITAKIQFI